MFEVFTHSWTTARNNYRIMKQCHKIIIFLKPNFARSSVPDPADPQKGLQDPDPNPKSRIADQDLYYVFTDLKKVEKKV
jgi:hypothetical protein